MSFCAGLAKHRDDCSLLYQHEIDGVLYLGAEPAELALTAGMKKDQEEREREADSERVSNRATKPVRELERCRKYCR